MRTLGVAGVIASILLGLALWLVVRDTTEEKLAVELASIVFLVVLVALGSIVAAATVAKVEDGRLDFFFCGVRTRSFALDGGTTFDLHKIGRLEVLRIRC